MTTKLFNELGLSPEILRAIDRLGFEQASPIQAEAIPVLLQGHDVVGQSQTGSGKTAAFAIPAIEKTDPLQRHVQILILCPTRELAVQVSEEIHKLALFKRGIHALPIYGGQSYERQFYGLKQGAQIVIGTPGRVMDHMRRGTLMLDKLKMLVLDEADVMLDMGFREDIEFVLQSLPKERQTVFFSATMPRPIRDLIERFAREPRTVQIEQKALTVPTVEQLYYEVDRRFKIELLTRLIDIHDIKLGIIFCNTKRMVDELVDHLEAQGYSADRLHGDMSQAMRDRVMTRFRKSGLEFLVATDVAARGIDVDDVEVVFNYDLPYDVEDYVHRIGRTGRAGRSGRAISFVAGREIFQVRNIERYTNTRIHRSRIPTASEVEAARDNSFVEKIRSILLSGEYRKQDHLIERLVEEGHASTDVISVLFHMLNGGAEPEPAPKAPRERADWSQGNDRPKLPASPIPARPAQASPAAPRALPPSTSKPARTPAPAPAAEPAVAAVPAAPEAAPTPATPAPAPDQAAPVPLPDPATTESPAPAASAATPQQPPTAEAPVKSGAPEPAATPAARKVSTPTTPEVVPHSAQPAEPRPKPARSDRPAFQKNAAPSFDRPPRSGAYDPERRPDPRRNPAGAPDRERPQGGFRQDRAPAPKREKDGGPRYRNMPEWAQKRMGVKPREPQRERERGERGADRRDPGYAPAPPYKPARGFGSAPAPHEGWKRNAPPSAPRKASRRTPENQTRLWMNVGEEMGVGPGDVVGAILGETGLPSGTVGVVDIRERHLFVDVLSEHSATILSKLRHTRIKGQPVKAKLA